MGGTPTSTPLSYQYLKLGPLNIIHNPNLAFQELLTPPLLRDNLCGVQLVSKLMSLVCQSISAIYNGLSIPETEIFIVSGPLTNSIGHQPQTARLVSPQVSTDGA